MNMRPFTPRARLLTAVAICTVIISSCATPWYGTSPTFPESSAAPAEISVAGARDGNSGLIPRSPFGARTRSVPLGVHSAADDNALGSVGVGEEVWIIATPSRAPARGGSEDDSPGTGAMLASFANDIDEQTGRAREIPLPL